ncbi:MAG: hypothetical protein JWM19_3204, partial [Actinomycetia bacterium]|nr:hypothetical protein [Actinomycetes bacterium]
MGRSHRAAYLAAGAALTAAAALVPAVMSTATAAAATATTARPAKPAIALAHVWLRVKQIGKLANGQPKFTSSTPTGLSPAAIQSVYSLSGLSPSSGA